MRTDTLKVVPFQLQRAAAASVAQALNTFYLTKNPYELQTQNLIRFTFDVVSNTVFVQASQQDMQDIRALIEHIDTMPPAGQNELEIVFLRNAVALDMYQLLLATLGNNILVAPVQIPNLGGGGIGGAQGGGWAAASKAAASKAAVSRAVAAPPAASPAGRPQP